MKVGFAHGAFDQFDDDDRQFLTACRQHCDYLVVAVCSDRFVPNGKQPEPLERRMLHVRSLAEAVIPYSHSLDCLIDGIAADVVLLAPGQTGVHWADPRYVLIGQPEPGSATLGSSTAAKAPP